MLFLLCLLDSLLLCAVTHYIMCDIGHQVPVGSMQQRDAQADFLSTLLRVQAGPCKRLLGILADWRGTDELPTRS
jgi:hypothetical protein